MFTSDPPGIPMKLYCIASIFSVFAATYLLSGYRYLVWATPVKNQLYQLAKTNRRVIYMQFNRYFIREDIMLKEELNPRIFEKLSQHDLREVWEGVNQ